MWCFKTFRSKCMFGLNSLHGFICIINIMKSCFSIYQDDPNTVDFILISRLPKTDGVSDSQHLFSHHACHCRQVFDNWFQLEIWITSCSFLNLLLSCLLIFLLKLLSFFIVYWAQVQLHGWLMDLGPCIIISMLVSVK